MAAATTMGIDSEFDSVDLSWQSPVCSARLDVLSVAIPVGDVTPAGYHECESFVIPFDLVPYFAPLLGDEDWLKVAHNSPMEAHCLGNMGIKVRNLLNTLSMARFLWPERANLLRGAFDLDSLCHWRFGRRKTEDFDEIFTYMADEDYLNVESRMWCLTCDGLSCRKKIGHPKEVRDVEVPRTRKVKRIIPLNEVREGHPLFERYKTYAAVDAVLAFQLWELMVRDMQNDRAYPWAGFARVT